VIINQPWRRDFFLEKTDREDDRGPRPDAKGMKQVIGVVKM